MHFIEAAFFTTMHTRKFGFIILFWALFGRKQSIRTDRRKKMCSLLSLCHLVQSQCRSNLWILCRLVATASLEIPCWLDIAIRNRSICLPVNYRAIEWNLWTSGNTKLISTFRWATTLCSDTSEMNATKITCFMAVNFSTRTKSTKCADCTNWRTF